jgi:hypothetical protein
MIAVHLIGILYIAALVVRDILRPEYDPVRRDGGDDPSGGVLENAPDVFTLGSARGPENDAHPDYYAVQYAESPHHPEMPGNLPGKVYK